MFGLILTVCLASSPACESMDHRTCLRQKECHVLFEPVAVEVKPTEKQCFMNGQMYIAKPGGWQDQHPELRIKAMRCGEKIEFDKHAEQEA
jgi:hypothetical protein